MTATLPLNERLRAVRERVHVSQKAAGSAIGLSQPTYSRIEDGERPLKADDLVLLAEAFGVRVSAITGLAEVGDRTRYAGRTDGSEADMTTLRYHLYAYFELDGFLARQGFSAP